MPLLNIWIDTGGEESKDDCCKVFALEICKFDGQGSKLRFSMRSKFARTMSMCHSVIESCLAALHFANTPQPGRRFAFQGVRLKGKIHIRRRQTTMRNHLFRALRVR